MHLTQCIFIPLLLTITVQSLDLLHLDLRELLEMLEMMDLKKSLGGDIVVDSWVPLVKYPSLLGQFKLTYACDLICDSFDALGTSPCRWRNEWTICGSGDELDWVRACGKWGEELAKDIFNTNIYPDGHFLLAGSQKKLPPDHSAMLVSDPIQCQHGDGKLTFNHWTSPRVRIRVCVRHPGSGKIFEWCSDGISKGAPGPSIVIIPGSIMHTFEAYNFVLDNFGKQGGIAVIDTVMYDAPAIYECAFVPHYEQAIPLNEDTCKKLDCDFDSTFCFDEEKGQDFKIGYEPVGSHHSGIRKPLKGDFAYVKGPSSASLDFSEINITRTTAFEFCFYQSTVYPKIQVILGIDEENDTTIFQSPNVSIVHTWQCQRSYLEPGYYFSLSIVTSEMRNSYSMVGIDEIALIDPLNGEPCSRSFLPKMPKLKNNKENRAVESENFGNDIIDNEITKTTKDLLSDARKFDTDSSKADSLPNRLPNLSQSLVPMEIIF